MNEIKGLLTLLYNHGWLMERVSTSITLKKILLSKELLEKCGNSISKNSLIVSLLSELNEILQAIETERIKTGLALECARCGLLNKDCCGRAIDLRYSVELLVINLLLGVDFKNCEQNKDSCYFLSRRGCILKARDVFCINYLCKKITDTIPPHRLYKLRDLEGRYLTLIFKLEEQIKSITGSYLRKFL